METRKTIGERLLERCKNRERSHPAIDKKVSRFEDRFARYGRTGAGSRISMFLSPDAPSAMPERYARGVGDGDWLSSAPYWARLQRLGNARLRREQRLAALASRTQHRSTLSAISRLPDARPRSLPFLGLTGLVADQFEVLAPLPRVEDLDQAGPVEISSHTQGHTWAGAGRASSPWLSREYTPAKVAEAKVRPIERIQERAPASRATLERAKTAVERSAGLPSRPVSVAPSGKLAEQADAPVKPSRRVRRSFRGRVNPVRYIEHDYEAALPDDFLPASRHAQGRLPAQRTGRRRGLRTAMSRSPLMAALEPSSQGTPLASENQPRVPSTPRARVGTGIARVGTGIGRATSRRTAHREVVPKTPLLSASPVRRPALMAPSAVTIAALEPQSLQDFAPDASPSTSRRSSVVAPTARAIARAEARPEPLFDKPLSARRPVASRPVLTRSGIYAPEAEVLVPGTAPIEVTEDAAPQTATIQAKRSTSAANALERMQTQVVASQPSKGVLGRASTPVSPSISGQKTVGSAATSLRPNALVKSASGAYVPAAELLTPADPASEVLTTDVASRSTVSRSTVSRSTVSQTTPSAPLDSASARESLLSRVDAREEMAEPAVRAEPQITKAASRLTADSPSIAATETRTLRPSTTTADATVLAPVLAAEVEELSQGQHAAERADRPPTIGQSTTKTVRGFKSSFAEVPDAPAERHVAPRRFTNPLSHIQTRRLAPGSRVPQSSGLKAGRIVLSSADSQQAPLSETASRRDTEVAAKERIESAWRSAGRPLDWTEARIDIIQVPLMVSAASGEREAPRTERTQAGHYVPARTGRGRASRDVMSGSDSVTLARPEPLADQGTDVTGVNAPPLAGDASAPLSERSTAIDPTRDEPMTVGERERRVGSWRSGFDATMGRVESGTVHRDLPIWAQRSTGRPRIKSGDDLVQQLAQARAPEEVVQVLMDQGNAARTATSSLPQPVIQVIQQIKTEATRAEEQVVQERRVRETTVPTETVRARASRREGLRSTTRVARGMTGLNPRGSSGGQSSQAMSKVTQLAKRLQELIAMAESQNRSGARQQVRMAEDSGAAKAEGQAAPTSAEGGRDASADIDTLAREVTEQVTRELEMRRERRQEDPDGRSIWW